MERKEQDTIGKPIVEKDKVEKYLLEVQSENKTGYEEEKAIPIELENKEEKTAPTEIESEEEKTATIELENKEEKTAPTELESEEEETISIELEKEDENTISIQPESEETIPEKHQHIKFIFAKKSKIIAVGIMIFLCLLIIFYLVMALFFKEHYYLGTKINGINVSGKSVQDVKELMTSELQTYTLNLKERGDKREQIKATDIGMSYNFNEEFINLIKEQKPLNWFLACFNSKNSKIILGITYDEKLLKERIINLSCLDSNNIIDPKNPNFQYIDNNYKVIDEIQGNKVDKERLNSYVTETLLSKVDELDLEENKCYINPKYNSQSQQIKEVNDMLNKYISSEINYTFGNSREIIDGSIINKWLIVDENYNVEIDKNKIEKYLDELCKKYNTPGRVRNFTTTSGETIQIKGGDYTNSINKTKEIKNIITIIEEGRIVNMDLSYSDIGNTYVEINIAGQHIWFYKDNKLITDGDVVTGNLSTNHATPPGVYSLKRKAKNAILRGPDYACPVAFWMPFYDGMGIHDATWRSYFGGDIYKTDGSHGCINCPYNLASVIYDNIEPGTPIVCY